MDDVMSLHQHTGAATTAQKVVIVNGRQEILDSLETVLDAGRYDLVFLQSSSHAYSQIKRVRPNLVILCVGIDDTDGCQVLSMLKLDEETRGIPVFTCTSEHHHDGSDEDEREEDGTGSGVAWFPAATTAIWMN